MDPKTLAEEILDRSRKQRIDGSEVYLLTSKATTLEVKEQKIDAFVSAASCGAGLRVFHENRVGFSHATLSDGSEIDALVERAVTAARYTEPDPANGVPGSASIASNGLDIYDAALQSVTEEQKIARAMALEQTARDTDDRVKVIRKAGYRDSEYTLYLLNSGGTDASYRGTHCSASVMLMASDGTDQQMGWDSDSSCFFAGLEVEAVGRKAAQDAVSLLGARTIPTVKTPVLLTPIAAVSFLEVFVSAFSSDAVQKGKSLLAGRVGKKVGSPKINLVDDGRLPGRSGTAPFDDEGVPTQRKFLIRDGILEGYLYNTYTAAREGVASTGNATRGGYGALPSVGPTNLFIEEGEGTHAALLKEMNRGLVIMDIMGMHTANPFSGDFSVGVSGLWVESGAVSHPVRGAAIAGNFLDLFNQVAGVGADLRFYGAVGSPSLLVADLSVSGE
jgi:PmbA protein